MGLVVLGYVLSRNIIKFRQNQCTRLRAVKSLWAEFEIEIDVRSQGAFFTRRETRCCRKVSEKCIGLTLIPA
jgi:hypothetical protein